MSILLRLLLSPVVSPRPTASHRRTWRGLVLGGIVLWIAGVSAPALAQEPAPCEDLLRTADEQYVQREYAEAETLVRACLAQGDVEDAQALQAYRLLTLIFLRQDDLPEARQAVVRMLGVSYEYDPDPVQDPPAYVALVASVKEQLRVSGAPVAADSSRIAPVVPEAGVPDPAVQIVQANPEPTEEDGEAGEQEAPRSRNGIVKWLLVGGGAVVAGVAAVLLTSGGSSSAPPGDTPLPLPPAFPR